MAFHCYLNVYQSRKSCFGGNVFLEHFVDVNLRLGSHLSGGQLVGFGPVSARLGITDKNRGRNLHFSAEKREWRSMFGSSSITGLRSQTLVSDIGIRQPQILAAKIKSDCLILHVSKSPFVHIGCALFSFPASPALA